MSAQYVNAEKALSNVKTKLPSIIFMKSVEFNTTFEHKGTCFEIKPKQVYSIDTTRRPS